MAKRRYSKLSQVKLHYLEAMAMLSSCSTVGHIPRTAGAT